MTKNVNDVPMKHWKRWSEKARAVFNRCYEYLLNNQGTMSHPDAERISHDHWTTFVWNAAWIAADACDDIIPTSTRDGKKRK